MNWDDLRIFLAIARAGSIMAAAKQLVVSHTTVSRRLGAFEAEIGVKLFERHPGKLLRTDAGEDLYERALRVEDEINGAERLLLGHDDAISGPLRVSAPLVTMSRWLFPYFREFSDKYPEVELQLIGTTNLLSLHRRELDVALRFTNQPPESAVGRKLMTAQSAVYGSREYMEKRGAVDNPNELDWIGLIPVEDDYDNPFLEKYLPNINVKWRVSETGMFYDAVLTGVGIARLPTFMADRDERLCRVPGLPTEETLDFWVLTHRDLRETRRVRRFLDFIVGKLREDIVTYNQIMPDSGTLP